MDAEMTKQQKIAKAKAEIMDMREDQGEYSHNIVSMTLRSIAKEFGEAEANRLVDECETEIYFAIGKHWTAKEKLNNKKGNNGFDYRDRDLILGNDESK